MPSDSETSWLFGGDAGDWAIAPGSAARQIIAAVNKNITLDLIYYLTARVPPCGIKILALKPGIYRLPTLV